MTESDFIAASEVEDHMERPVEQSTKPTTKHSIQQPEDRSTEQSAERTTVSVVKHPAKCTTEQAVSRSYLIDCGGSFEHAPPDAARYALSPR